MKEYDASLSVPWVPPNRLVSVLMLTGPVCRYELSREYPIRQRIHAFPPMPVGADGESPALVIVTSAGNIHDACWAGYSFLPCLPKNTPFILVVHGDIPPQQEEQLTTLFPNVSVCRAEDVAADLMTSHPGVHSLLNRHPLGAKLLSILSLQSRRDIIYCDSDVLCLNSVPELHRALCSPTANLFLVDANSGLEDSALTDSAIRRGIAPAKGLNSGLLVVRKQSLSIDLAEDLIAECDSTGKLQLDSWFIEQTILSVLMNHAGALPLPVGRYVVSMARQFYFQRDVAYSDIAVRHFVGPVRHRMYTAGMPYLYRRWKKYGWPQSGSLESLQ